MDFHHDCEDFVGSMPEPRGAKTATMQLTFSLNDCAEFQETMSTPATLHEVQSVQSHATEAFGMEGFREAELSMILEHIGSSLPDETSSGFTDVEHHDPLETFECLSETTESLKDVSGDFRARTKPSTTDILSPSPSEHPSLIIGSAMREILTASDGKTPRLGQAEYSRCSNGSNALLQMQYGGGESAPLDMQNEVAPSWGDSCNDAVPSTLSAVKLTNDDDTVVSMPPIRGDDGLFSCTLCDMRFKQTGNRKKHIEETHMRRKPFSCSVCHVSFSRKHARDTHQRAVHQQLRPYSCPYCLKLYKNRSDLNKHIRSVEKREKPFSCDTCGKCFAERGKLQRHAAIHIPSRNVLLSEALKLRHET
jgi:Zinc finger, C2H2 type